MDILAQRLRYLRDGVRLSQVKIANIIGTTQASINRYETGQSVPPPKVLLWYADYFDVSMDYIYGRTDNPQGKLYNYQPELVRQKAENNEELKQFVEMCFDPQSPLNDRLKQTLLSMLEEAKK